MKYTLITSKGTIMRFYIEDCALAYRVIYGGAVFCEKIMATGEIAQEEVQREFV